MNEKDKVIIEKILNYCIEIEQTHEFFQSDRDKFNSEKGFVYRNSVTMPILQIGELTKNLSDCFTVEHSNIPWKNIAGMRDIFAHHYGSIDYDMVWNTSKEDVSELKSFCEEVLA